MKWNAVIFLIGMVIASLVFAHDGHEHGEPLAVSLAFDPHGQLWRVSAKGGYVWVDYSTDMAKSFSAPIKLNAEPQKIGVDGDARPKIAVSATGNIYVTWTQALPTPYTGYVWFARSTDQGKRFENPIIVHQDRAEITHRFDAITVAPSGRIYIAWIDKRDLVAAKSKQEKYEGAAIYYALSDDQGASFSPEQKLADNSCECCRIAMGTTQDGQAVAMWRHLFAGGVRDHAMAQFGNGAASQVHRASFGNWKVEACPHHGPAIARGDQEGKTWGWHMAWFDGATESKPAGLFYARMDSEAWVTSPAKRFGDAAQQAGHPALFSQGEHVWLAWKELTPTNSLVKLAESKDGGRSWESTREISNTAGKSDYPQLMSDGQHVYLAWNTEHEGLRMISVDAP